MRRNSTEGPRKKPASKMAVVELRKCLITLVVLYVFAVLFALVASVPMIMHVYPQSECLLFSSENNSRLFYGHWACE